METKIKVWKTIKIGNGPKTGEEYIELICSKKKIVTASDGQKCSVPIFKISQSAVDALESSDFKVSKEETEIELVKMSLKDLGLKDGAQLSEVLNNGLKDGRALCPAEVGPQLRLQYEDQPAEEHLIVAMKSVVDHQDFPLLFGIENDAFQWLETFGGFSSNTIFSKDPEFVFWQISKN